jgi:hypothetical protein
MQRPANNPILTRRDRLRTKASGFSANVGQQIAGNLYRGGGGRFTAGSGGGTTPSSAGATNATPGTPAQQRQAARSRERNEYGRAEDARRQAEDDAIAREPNRTKRGALRRATLLARRQRLYARREQRRKLDEQDQQARVQEAQARAERRAQRLAEALAKRDAAREARRNEPKAPKPKKPTAEETRAENRKRVRSEMAASDSGLSPAGFDALMAFGEGHTIDAVYDTGLREFGLLEGDPPRLTTAGNQAIRAANKGDYRAAVDAVNKGTERAKKRTTTAQNKVDEEAFRAIEDRLISAAPTAKERAALRRRFVIARRDRKRRRADGERVQPPPQRDVQKSFTVFKDARGAYRWLAISSTAYRDRDREIVSRKALQGAVASGDRSGERGPLRFWHVPGLDLGECDYQATSHDGRLLVESGTFYRPDYAMALKDRGAGYGVSIGFMHPPDQPDRDGVFHDITIFERSITPPGKASNPFTSITTKESRMLTPDKEAQLATLLGGRESAAYKAATAQMAQTDKTAQESGVTFKEAPEEALPLLTDADGQQYTLKEGKLIALKAAMPAPEMEQAGATEMEDGAAQEGALEDEALLGQADFVGIAKAVVQEIAPFFDLQKQVGDLKSALNGQMVATKEEAPKAEPVVVVQKAADQPTLESLMAEVTALRATVKSLQGDQPVAAGARATQSAETVVATTDPLMAGYKAVTDDPQNVVNSFLNGFQGFPRQ